MIIRKVELEELWSALLSINLHYYEGNARFFDGTPEIVGNKAYRVRLAVVDNNGKGAIRTVSKGWRSPYACWHLHGHFFQALPAHAKVYSHGRRFMAHDKWEDWNAGSMMHPVMQSQRCLCNSPDGKLLFTPIFAQDSVLYTIEYNHEELEKQLTYNNLKKIKKDLEDELELRRQEEKLRRMEESADDVYMRLMNKRLGRE